MFFLCGINNISMMSVQHSEGFPRTCPRLPPTSTKSPEWPFKNKGPNPGELSGCWWTCPQHEPVTLHSPRNHLMDLGPPTPSESASQHKNASWSTCSSREEQDTCCQQGFHSSYNILPKNPQRLHTAELMHLNQYQPKAPWKVKQ